MVTRTVEIGWGWGHNLWGWGQGQWGRLAMGTSFVPMQLSSPVPLKVSQRITFREWWNKILIVG